MLKKKISFYLLFKEVAVKLKFQKVRHPQLLYENKLYMTLHGGISNPHIQWRGKKKIHNVLVMDFSATLGRSLQFLLKKFSQRRLFLLAEQMVSRTDYVH